MEISQVTQSFKNTSLTNENTKPNSNFSQIMDTVAGAMNNVNNSQLIANEKVESMIKGEDVTMHEVMISMQESQISMQLLIEMRNKFVEAYQEINKVTL